MKDRMLCIEVTSINIRICEIEISKKAKEIKLLHNININSENNVSDTELYSVDSLAYSIRNELRERKIKTKKCIICINSNNIYGRNIIVPYQPTSDKLLEVINAHVESNDIFPAVELKKTITTYSIINKIINREIEDDDNDDIEFENEETKEKKVKKKKPKKKKNKVKNTSNYNVMVYNAPTTLITSATNLAKLCKLQLIGINYSGNSVSQYVKNTHGDGSYMLVYVNDINSIILVEDNGILISQKIDDFNYMKIARKILNNQAVTGCDTIEKAISFIEDTGFLDEEYEERIDISDSKNEELYYLRKEIIEDILNFMDTVKAYLASVRRETSIDSLIYMCNNSSFPSLAASIEAELSIDVIETGDEITEYDKELINCIYSSINTINFNIQESNKIVENRRFRQYMLVGTVFTTWMCALYVGFNIFKLNELNNENKEYQKKLEEANEAQVIYTNYQQSQVTRDEIEAFDATSQTMLNDIDSIINSIQSAVPSDKLHIDNLMCTLDSMSMAIRADSKDTVAYFIENLEMLDMFEKVDVPSVSDTGYKDEDEAGNNTGEGTVEEDTFPGGREVTTNVTCIFKKPEVEEEIVEEPVIEDSGESGTDANIEDTEQGISEE